MICAPGLNNTGWKWSRTKLITFKVIRWDEMWYVRWQTMGLATLGTFDLFLPFSYLLFLAQIFEELLDPRCDTNHACGTFVFDQRATEIYLWQLICNYIARKITFINIISNINQDHQGNLISHHWTFKRAMRPKDSLLLQRLVGMVDEKKPRREWGWGYVGIEANIHNYSETVWTGIGITQCMVHVFTEMVSELEQGPTQDRSTKNMQCCYQCHTYRYLVAISS